jgi:hypothetical protein
MARPVSAPVAWRVHFETGDKIDTNAATPREAGEIAARRLALRGSHARIVKIKRVREQGAVPSGEAADTLPSGFPSHAVQRDIAAVHAARVMKPFSPVLTILAVSMLVLALASAFSAVAAADRAIELQERV